MNASLSSPALRRLFALAFGWMVAASLFACFVLPRLPGRAAVPAGVIVLTAVAHVLVFATALGRKGMETLGARGILLLHTIRMIGALFLWAQAHGGFFPVQFAVPAGWGDIIAALGALLLLAWPDSAGWRRLVLLWGIFGWLDLANVLRVALTLNVTQPGSMDTMTQWPWTLLPTFLVPWMLASHTWLLLNRESAWKSA